MTVSLPPALIPLLMTVPVLVGLQLALSPRYIQVGLTSNRLGASLCRALNLPWGVTHITIDVGTHQLATMTITKILSAAEIDALSKWYQTESLDHIPCSETTYSFLPREPQ